MNKKVLWIGGISIIFLISVALAIIIPILVNVFIWTPLIIVLSVWAVIGIIIGIVFLIAKISKKPNIPEEVDSNDAKIRARNESLNDEDDPDNFIIQDELIYKVKEKGVNENTPILRLMGWGSETNKPRTCLINLKLPTEKSWIKGDKAIDEEYLRTWAIRMAETQPDEETEKITTGRDQFGLPTITRETKRPSPSEEKEKKEKEDAESKNII